MIETEKVVNLNLAIKMRNFPMQCKYCWIKIDQQIQLQECPSKAKDKAPEVVAPAPTEEELLTVLPKSIERYSLRRYKKGEMNCVEYLDGHQQIYRHCQKKRIKLVDALAELWLELEETGW